MNPLAAGVALFEVGPREAGKHAFLNSIIVLYIKVRSVVCGQIEAPILNTLRILLDV